MYVEHFGFLQEPFGATSDPKFLYFGFGHSEALASLHYGLLEKRGLLVLIARPGLGKTSLLLHLLDRWADRAETAFLPLPPQTREQMIGAILDDLGLASGSGYDDACRLLRAKAIDCHRKGKRLLVAFDEAQAIPPAVLEEIRLLSNLESPEKKLIEIILAGQPALGERLAAPEWEHLRQRVALAARLDPLETAEVRRYVEHRLGVAGHRRGRIFTPGALAVLARTAEGIPRNINAICFDALSLAYGAGMRKVDERLIAQAAASLAQAETMLSPGRPRLVSRPRRWQWAAASAAVLLLAATMVAGGYWHRVGLPGTRAAPALGAAIEVPEPAVTEPAPSRLTEVLSPGPTHGREAEAPKPSPLAPAAKRSRMAPRPAGPRRPGRSLPGVSEPSVPPVSELLRARLRPDQLAALPPAAAGVADGLSSERYPAPPISELLRQRSTPLSTRDPRKEEP